MSGHDPELQARVGAAIRAVPDFPKAGILFRDITTALADGPLFTRICDWFAGLAREARVDRVAGIESRGFVFAAPVAHSLSIPLVLVRKPGKLPWRTRSATYELEYGTDSVEVHEDAVRPGEKVMLVDDLLATGGTAEATARLLREIGGEVAVVAFLIELAELDGRSRLGGLEVHSLVSY